MSILLIAQCEEEIIPTTATQIVILLPLDSPTASDSTFSSSVLFSIYFSSACHSELLRDRRKVNLHIL